MQRGLVLNIALFGHVRLSGGDQEIKLRSRKARALIGYLALTEAHRDSREGIAGVLWGETGEKQARDSLRQIVKELRDAFKGSGCQGLVIDPALLALDPACVTVDLWDVQRDAAAGRVHPLLLRSRRITETLMRGLEDLDEVFRGWLLPRRQTIHSQLLRDFESALRSTATPAARRADIALGLLNLDPSHEEACRAAMRLRAEEGDSAGAQRHYEQLLAVLDEDFDMEPTDETTSLYADIKAGLFEAARPPIDDVVSQGLQHALVSRAADDVPVRQLPAKLALLIEPFGMNGVAPDQAHLVEGFRHSLVASLIRFREWYVADAVTHRANGGKAQDVSAFYTITATAYQAGGTISVMMTLRDLDANLYIWSNSFELSLSGWFEAQQRIVRRLAMSLNVQLSADRLMRLEGRPDVALDIHDRWLRGQALARRFGADNWNRAARLYEDMIRDAPHFSPAYSSLVQMNNVVHMANPGMRRDMARAEATLALARKAVTLDPLDSRAQLALGWALAMMDRNAQAVAPMDLACDLNPYDSWTLISAALFHAYNGTPARARALADDSMQLTLTPTLMQWGYDGTIRFIEGDYRAVVDATEQAQDVIPTLPAWRAAALHHLGEQRAAAREARRFVETIRTRWSADTPATDEAIGRWLLHQYPLARRSDWERLRAGIAGAGIPVGRIEHRHWWAEGRAAE
jgi:DNA-binding SARP family transcriptional activator